MYDKPRSVYMQLGAVVFGHMSC